MFEDFFYLIVPLIMLLMAIVWIVDMLDILVIRRRR